MAIRILSNETIDGTLVITKGITTGSATGGNSGSVTIAGGITQSFQADGSTVTYGSHTNTATATSNTDASAFLISQKNTGGTAIEYRQGVIADGNAFFGKWQSGSITGIGLNVATGNVTFSGSLTGTTGTFTGLVSGITPTAASNYAIKSYVDAHGGGVGPFLPLAGGTLTGALTMGGNLNMNSRKITNINEMSFGANAYITSPSNFLVRFNQTSVDIASGNLTASGSGTFTGNINAARGFFNSGSTNVVSTFTSTDGIAAIALIDSGGNVELSASSNTFQVQPAGGAAALTVSSTNAIFTGNVGIGVTGPGEALELAGNIRIHNSSNAPYIDFVESGATSDSKARITMDQVDTSNGQLIFSTENGGTLTTALTIDSSQNATFSNRVTVGGYFQVNSTTTLGGAVTIEGNLFMDGYNITSIDELSASTATFSGTINSGAITSTGAIIGQVNSNTFGTSGATGRALIVQAGSSNQAIMLKNSLGGDGTISVTGTATTMNYSFGTYSTGDALFIQNDGSVGIGTDSPGQKLHVSGGKIEVDVNSSVGTEIILKNLGVNQFAADKNYHEINFITSNTSSETTGGYVRIKGGQEVSGNDNKSYLGFWTAPNSGTVSERMRIDSAGNVGIGTDSPDAKLQINSATPDFLITDSDISTSLPMFRVRGFDGGGWATRGSVISSQVGGAATDVMSIINGSVVIGNEPTPTASCILTLRTSASTGLSIKSASNTGESFINFGDNDDINPGQIYYGHTDNAMRFRTNDAERMRIDSSGFTTISNNPTSTQATLTLKKLSNSVAINNTLGYLNFYSNDASTSSSGGVGGIGVYAETDYNTSHTPSYMSFYTHSTATNDGTNIGNVTERMRITSGGEVFIGTNGNAPSASQSGFSIQNNAGLCFVLQATSDVGTNTCNHFINPNGTVGKIQTSGFATNYVTSSDYRLKEDLQDFNGLDKVSKIPVYDFKWKPDESRSYGVMAHELQDIVPDAVSGEKDEVDKDGKIEPQGVDYSKIVPLLVKAIQELKAEIEILKKK